MLSSFYHGFMVNYPWVLISSLDNPRVDWKYSVTTPYPRQLLMKYLKTASFLYFLLGPSLRPLNSFLWIMVFPRIKQRKIIIWNVLLKWTLNNSTVYIHIVKYHVTVSWMNVLSRQCPLQTSHLILPPPLHRRHLSKQEFAELVIQGCLSS